MGRRLAWPRLRLGDGQGQSPIASSPLCPRQPPRSRSAAPMHLLPAVQVARRVECKWGFRTGSWPRRPNPRRRWPDGSASGEPSQHPSAVQPNRPHEPVAHSRTQSALAGAGFVAACSCKLTRGIGSSSHGRASSIRGAPAMAAQEGGAAPRCSLGAAPPRAAPLWRRASRHLVA